MHKAPTTGKAKQ
jgi:hypothetical protein